MSTEKPTPFVTHIRDRRETEIEPVDYGTTIIDFTGAAFVEYERYVPAEWFTAARSGQWP